jgi:tyrosyl-tRNA synthetase
MSKSLGNQIGVTDPPEEMYGKAMAIPDQAMADYYRLLLGRAIAAPAQSAGDDRAGAAAAAAETAAAEPSARDAKRALARGLVTWLHSAEAAEGAERHFDRVFVAHEAPAEIEEASFDSDGGLIHLPGLIAQEFGISRSEARRLIDQGGVTLGESSLAAGEHDVPGERADGEVLKVGKRRFRRLRAR